MIEKISTNKAGQPGGWYSQAFKVGNLIYTAGVFGNDPKTDQLVEPGNVSAQTRQIMENLKAILEEAGSDLEHIFKTLVFLKDIDRFSEFNEVYKEYFKKDPPARSTIQIGKFKNGMEVEIEVIATVK